MSCYTWLKLDFQNWTGNMQKSDLFAQKYRKQIENMHAQDVYEKIGRETKKYTLRYVNEGFDYLEIINMRFCQNPVECQPPQSHVQSSQWMSNISAFKNAMIYSNGFISMLNSGAIL